MTKATENLKSFWEEFRRLVLNQPSIGKLKSPPLEEKLIDLGNDLNRLLSGPSKRIFVIGKWGSGKTTHLQEYIRRHINSNSPYKFSERIFFGVQTLDDGFMNLLSLKRRVISVLLFTAFLTCGYTILSNVPQWHFVRSTPLHVIPDLLKTFIGNVLQGALLAGITYLFLTNKLRAFYGFACGLDLLHYFCKKRRITVLEDLDRSSMKEEDRWALLASLWTWNLTYIIAYGYDSSSDRDNLMERIKKLEGEYVEVRLNKDINFALISKLEPDFPFLSGDWLNVFTPRDVRDWFKRKELGDLNDPKFLKQARMVNAVIQLVLENLGIPLRTPSAVMSARYSQQKVIFSFHSREEDLPMHSKQIMQSLGSSIRKEFIGEFIGHIANYNNGDVNWIDIQLQRLTTLPRDDVFFKELERLVINRP